MDKLSIKLVNCHGIRDLDAEFEFTDQRNAVAIYAPNGTMKTSFARTFADLAKGDDSLDHMFVERETTREIVDETGTTVAGANVVVVLSYDEELGPNEATSTLLVNRTLRREYEEIQRRLLKVRDELISALKAQARTRSDVAEAISQTFTQERENFFPALVRVKREVETQTDAPFASIPYDVFFNGTIVELLRTAPIQEALAEYVTRLNELLDQSRFFNRETFTFYNAANVTRSLGDNGFFDANHALLLKGGEGDEEQMVANSGDLKDLIDSEKRQITEDDKLRNKLDAVEKALDKNAATRAFFKYISANVELLPELTRPEVFAQNVWKSYFKSNEDLFNEAVECFYESQDRQREIEEQAVRERTQWQRVIEIFNKRFYVPFELIATNRAKVVLGQESLLKLGFAFSDGDERREVDREELLKVLSNGEKKALYILNVLFEVETRKASSEPTLFVIDDIADSFDYKNKYAIIHYLKEMSEHDNFRLILLTHNFDFFRTLNSRGITPYHRCFMARRAGNVLRLEPADMIKNPFINDFKSKFYREPMSRAACIPFIRNILEYTIGTTDSNYLALTSLLHWKIETPDITNGDLDGIFASTFSAPGAWEDPDSAVVDLVFDQANLALEADEGVNFANKLVLSIAIRLKAESFMIEQIDDDEFVAGITGNQTIKLLKKYKEVVAPTDDQLQVLELVVLMTPENIHFNSFMYEPIIDLSDDHLRDLYSQVLALHAT